MISITREYQVPDVELGCTRLVIVDFLCRYASDYAVDIQNIQSSYEVTPFLLFTQMVRGSLTYYSHALTTF